MTDTWITPDGVFENGTLRSGVSLCLGGGVVLGVTETQKDARRIRGIVAPGFVDLQVNGGGGVLLNTAPSAQAMAEIAAAHRSFGTVAILPTVITDSADILDRAVNAALEAQGQRGIAGLHLEGPHIAMARRGTHSPHHVRPMDQHTMDAVIRLRSAGIAVMITLAPEAVETDQIAALASTGAIVSIGHTDASAEDVEAAILAGASCGTHLYNAMSPMTSRAPGAVGAILNAGLHFGIICDGHHVDDRMVQLALRATPRPERAFLVSDAMATVGGPDEFMLYGQPVRLRNGRLVNAEGNLAGAHITQAEGVERLVSRVGLSIEDALRMAISTPSDVIGRPDLSGIEGRRTDDCILVDNTGALLGPLDRQ